MRRSICYCEPHVALAGQLSTWRFIYQTSTVLPKGSLLKFDLLSEGRDIDWELPRVGGKGVGSLIYGEFEDGELIQPKEVEKPESLVPQFEFTLTQPLKAGAKFSVVLGDAPSKGGKAVAGKGGSRAQTTVQRRRPFLLYIDPKGKGSYGEPELFTMDIRGNALHTINLLAPSLAIRNKRFDITIRFEDEFGNLTGRAPEGTLIDLSYQNLRENLSWRLFVPETGFVTLPNLYFNEAGVYKILLKNLQNGKEYLSAPIKCFEEGSELLYWGLLHGESDKVDSTENIESCLRHFRDDRSLSFFATSSPDGVEETSNDAWKSIGQNVAAFNEEDRFSTALGFQWRGESPAEGVRQMVYLKDGKPLLRSSDVKSNALKKIYRSTLPKDLISIPSFTMAKGLGFDFSDFSSEFERVVEIYNAWGSSECTEEEGNPRPIAHEGKKGVKEWPEGSIRAALNRNRRFGFVAGGLDDRGPYSDLFEAGQTQYSPGLTAVLAARHTRDALLEAVSRRSCYATTGARIILGLSVTGVGMGGELSTADLAGLHVNRHLAGYVHGTANLERVEIIRNGETLQLLDFEGGDCEFTYDDLTDLSSVAITPEEGNPFVYYYLRAIQSDGQMAWSSPIWVDLSGDSSKVVKKARPKGK